jgi:hypothetical protein
VGCTSPDSAVASNSSFSSTPTLPAPRTCRKGRTAHRQVKQQLWGRNQACTWWPKEAKEASRHETNAQTAGMKGGEGKRQWAAPALTQLWPQTAG